uniref:Uncharacterized protein n=1 Tax=Periophthalmus magnuspinnatus TaxID=409849 RepID=A0A3B3ZZL4_9GOBI
MDTKEELLPFIREMLQQKPTRSMIKIYAIGSTLAKHNSVTEVGWGEVSCSMFRAGRGRIEPLAITAYILLRNTL